MWHDVLGAVEKRDRFLRFLKKSFVRCHILQQINNIWMIRKMFLNFIQTVTEKNMSSVVECRCIDWNTGNVFGDLKLRLVFELYEVSSSILQHIWRLTEQTFASSYWKYNSNECWCCITCIKLCFLHTDSDSCNLFVRKVTKITWYISVCFGSQITVGFFLHVTTIYSNHLKSGCWNYAY